MGLEPTTHGLRVRYCWRLCRDAVRCLCFDLIRRAAGLLLAQERLGDGGGRDGLLTLLLGAFQRAGEVGEFVAQPLGLAEGRNSGLVREGAGLLGHGSHGDCLFAPLTFGGQRLA